MSDIRLLGSSYLLPFRVYFLNPEKKPHMLTVSSKGGLVFLYLKWDRTRHFPLRRWPVVQAWLGSAHSNVFLFSLVTHSDFLLCLVFVANHGLATASYM